MVGVLTPQRNVMTLAAKDTRNGAVGLYRQVFAQGLLSGWKGGSRPTLAAAPQFTAIGPLYLYAETITGSSVAAVTIAAMAESLMSWSAQQRNAQVQFNATRSFAADHIPLTPSSRLIGPGFLPHVARNWIAMTGIRLFSPYSYEVVAQSPGSALLGEESRLISADFLASVPAAVLSMPFNHVFSWASCTPEYGQLSWADRGQAAAKFLFSTYQQQGMRLLMRDLGVRITYTSFLFTGYRWVERGMLRWGNSGAHA